MHASELGYCSCYAQNSKYVVRVPQDIRREILACLREIEH